MTSGTLISYHQLCHRKLWLYTHGIRMEHTSETVSEGRWISESSYPHRPSRWQELDLGYIKIDHFDPETNTVHEIKKSPKLEHAHIAQVKYYLYTLENNGLQDVKGLIEYPKQKKTTSVSLTEDDKKKIPEWESAIREIISRPDCPPLIKKPYCKTCSFFEFCYT